MDNWEGEPVLALEHTQRALRECPEEPANWLNRAIAYNDLGQPELALADLDHLLRVFPQSPLLRDAHRLSGQIRHRLGQYRKAVFHHRQSLRRGVENSCCWDELAEALFFAGHMAGASRRIMQAFLDRQPPQEAEFLWYRVLPLAGLGQWRAAARAARGFLASFGWEDDLSPYAAVYWALAEREQTSLLLARCGPGWPRPVLQALAGELSPQALLQEAEDQNQRVEARVYLFLAGLGGCLKTLAEQPAERLYELGLAHFLLKPARNWPWPTAPGRRLAWLWGANQAELDRAAAELAARPEREGLPCLALALQLGARVPDLSILTAWLRQQSPLPEELALVGIYSFDPKARLEARGLPCPGKSWLERLLAVPHQEELVVVHPEAARAARVRVSGVADNFQLHILLADLLVGRLGWPGFAPKASVAAVFAGEAYQSHPTEVAQGVWNLYHPRALKLGYDDLEGWIWNEGSWGDIPYDHALRARILLLGPPAAQRTFNAARVFADLPASIELLEELPAEPILSLQGRYP